MSQNSPFLVDEYPISIGSPFSVEECCAWTPNTQSPPTITLSHEFSIDEYDYNEDLTNEENDIQVATSVVGVAHTEVNERNEATNVCVEEIQSASPMHFRRVPWQIRRDRFDLVTLERQVSLYVSKSCCACGCMPMFGKDKLRALQCYYFSLTTYEEDTYLTTHMQMVSDISSDILISFEYYIFYAQQCCRVAFKFSLCVSNRRLHRVQQQVINGDLSIHCNNVPSMNGAARRHAIGWMKNYFKLIVK